MSTHRSIESIRQEAKIVSRLRVERWLVRRLCAEQVELERATERADWEAVKRGVQRARAIRELLETFREGRE